MTPLDAQHFKNWMELVFKMCKPQGGKTPHHPPTSDEHMEGNKQGKTSPEDRTICERKMKRSSFQRPNQMISPSIGEKCFQDSQGCYTPMTVVLPFCEWQFVALTMMHLLDPITRLKDLIPQLLRVLNTNLGQHFVFLKIYFY